MMKCEKSFYDHSCMGCTHAEDHELNINCLGQKCVSAAVAFAKRNKNCKECEYSKTCTQYSIKKQNSIDFIKRKAEYEKNKSKTFVVNETILATQQSIENPVIDLFKRGEDCGRYNQLITMAKCVEVE